MKKRSILSLILATLLCFSSLFVGAASALTMGDVDGNGEIKAADARLALRASVSLENLTEQQKKAADVNYDGEIKAADARLILRASVGLEEIENREPEKKEHPEHHIFNTISTTNVTKCAFEGCEAELPAFNTMVNALKSTENGANYFTGFIADLEHNDKMDISGSMASFFEDETNVASTNITYSTLAVNRLLTPNNFPTNGATYVSSLTDSDIKSITIEKASSVDFVKSMPDSYTVGKTIYDLTPIKNAEFPEVYKITVVLNSENADLKKEITKQSKFDKIYVSEYNENLENLRRETNSAMKELDEMGISTSGGITSALTVEYYVTTDTFTPVAARYLNRLDITFTAKMPLVITMKQDMYTESTSYYFFNNDFGITK